MLNSIAMRLLTILFIFTQLFTQAFAQTQDDNKHRFKARAYEIVETLKHMNMPGSRAELVKLAKAAIAVKYGQTPKNLTQLSCGEDFCIIYGTGQIEGHINYNIDDLKYVTLPIPSSNYSEVSWEMSGRIYRAVISEIVNSKPPKLQSEPFANKLLWDDKQLSGAIVISSNLAKVGIKTANQYIQYYAQNGFEFTKIQSSNPVDFLSDLIQSDRVDYIVKESHSSGNVYDLLVTSQRAQILVGKKLSATSTSEIIYIIYSDMDDLGLPKVRLNPHQLNKLMYLRNLKTNNPLIFINSSCWGGEKFTLQKRIIDNENLFLISAHTKTSIFYNRPDDVKKLIIDGIRAKKNFSLIQNQIEALAADKPSHLNHFLLPGEFAYDKAVLDRSRQFDIKLFDNSENEIFMDEMLDAIAGSNP